MKEFVIQDGVLKEYHGTTKDVVVPDGVREIAYRAFGVLESEHVESVVLPEGVTQIHERAFHYLQNLKKVVLPSTLESIGSYAFCECVALEELMIPDSVTEIGDHAFASCYRLNVTIPTKLNIIEEAAFRYCDLTSIVIPAGVKKIGKEAFKNCNNIKTAGPIGGGYDYEFPWTEAIPDHAFEGMKKLKTVVLPATIKKVGMNAFKDCKALSDLTMPKEAKVGGGAFKGCTKLGDIKEPGQESQPKKAVPSEFIIVNGTLSMYTGKKTEVTVPDGVTTIGRRAFYWNTTIQSVTLPPSVEIVEQQAFSDCPNLHTIQIQSALKKVGGMAFGWLYHKKDLERYLYTKIPIQVFSKAEFGGQGDVTDFFRAHFQEFDPASQAYRENLAFVGAQLKKLCASDENGWIEELVDNEPLRHALLDTEAIPAKDVKKLIKMTQAHPAITAELLDYQNRLLSDDKVRKSLEKAEERELEKALSTEISVADWRKRFKFAYQDGFVVIKEVREFDEVLTVPSAIGSKQVRTIARGAMYFGEGKSPREMILSEGVAEICPGAFLLAEGVEIFFPSTVTSLPRGCFVACHDLTLHLTAAVTEIHEELAWDGPDPQIKAIHAPTGSYAETYAKAHNIPFTAE